MIENQVRGSGVIQFLKAHQRALALLKSASTVYPSQGPTIADRLKVLDREWDIDRVLAATGVGLSIGLLLLAPRRCQRWVALGFTVRFFGLCLAAGGARNGLRKLLRLRTRTDIDAEKFALQVIRGDFDGIDDELRRRACAMNVLRSNG
jgi:hypothetical protein